MKLPRVYSCDADACEKTTNSAFVWQKRHFCSLECLVFAVTTRGYLCGPAEWTKIHSFKKLVKVVEKRRVEYSTAWVKELKP